jgi:hypothetical protein
MLVFTHPAISGHLYVIDILGKGQYLFEPAIIYPLNNEILQWFK